MYILVLNAGLFARFLLWGLKEWKARFLRQLLGLPILVTLAYVWYIGLIFFGEIDRFLVLKMENEVVEIAVGGVLYSLAKSDIQRYPGSFLDCIIKKEWSKGNDGKISIDRDGQLFKYLYAFLVCGSVPRDQDGALTLDAETLAALKVEADFYGLEKLARECETPLKTTSAANVTSYMTMRRYIEYAKGRLDTFEVEHPTALFTTELLHTLSEVWAPFCLTGRLIVNDSFRKPSRLFMSSTIAELNISELLNHATLSSFGHGTNTVTDTSVRNSFEINASQLEHEALEFIQKFVYLDNFMLNVKLETRPYKLVIYKEGGHFDAHRDTVRGEGHIGTLVLILNSTYTGGELEVTHGGRTEVVTGPYSWVAMYGDCLHKINLVTSGTRVSLIFDIYLSPNNPSPKLENSVSLLQKANKGTDLRTATASVTTDAAVVAADHHLDNNSQASSSEHSSAVYSTSDEQEQQEEEPEENNDLIDFDEEIPSDSYADSDFWNRSYREVAANLDERVRGADSALQVRIRQALDKELTNFDTIIICLRHLYPECQTHPSALKGGDRVLYDILLSNTTTTDDSTAGTSSTSSSADSTSESIYEVQVVAATIYRANDPAFHLGNVIQGRLFSPAIVQQTLTQETNSVNAASVNDHASEPASKKLRSEHRTKLVIPNAMHCDNFLDYSPYQAYTGNDSQAEETVYIVAGLQVRRKAV